MWEQIHSLLCNNLAQPKQSVAEKTSFNYHGFIELYATKGTCFVKYNQAPKRLRFCYVEEVIVLPTIEIIVRITESDGVTEEKQLMVWSDNRSNCNQSSPQPNLLFCNMEIYLKQRRVLKDGTDIHLTKNEYNVLVFLAQHPGEVFTKEQIFEAVWHENSESCLSAVTNTISRIRHKIESVPDQPIYIRTVSNLGYTFAAEPLPE